ncbi:hypothetical protein [Amycolatopsis regifaucium]|uniref:hypothetical protein n=1 Tax=Amycolatopsis regifaucium TaxID=546365 RepID=UPI0008F68418|nr:hypothetical protein [Amycolatopsis regifaucium]SFG83942.1 hypothetical protein SAMN04489731_101658 [Amycolatopsis regifaucium]
MSQRAAQWAISSGASARSSVQARYVVGVSFHAEPSGDSSKIVTGSGRSNAVARSATPSVQSAYMDSRTATRSRWVEPASSKVKGT